MTARVGDPPLDALGHYVLLADRLSGRRHRPFEPKHPRDSCWRAGRRLVAGTLSREADKGVRRVRFVDESQGTRARAALRRSASADFEVSCNALDEILMAAAAQVADITMADGPVRLASEPGVWTSPSRAGPSHGTTWSSGPTVST